MITALHLCQKSIISSGPASACAPAVGALHADIQCLPVSELLIISTLVMAKPRADAEVNKFSLQTKAEAEAEAEAEHFDKFGRSRCCHSAGPCEILDLFAVNVN